MKFCLVYGIANPQPLKEYISENTAAYEEISYSDHYIFSIDDLRDISKKFEKIKAKQVYSYNRKRCCAIN